MGKRKSRTKPAPKKKMEKLGSIFTCPFCNNADGVECEIDMKDSIATASCRFCLEEYHTKATRLTEPIDIYSEWIDECERANAIEDEDEDEDAEKNVHWPQTGRTESVQKMSKIARIH